jgi:hypothetical protein
MQDRSAAVRVAAMGSMHGSRCLSRHLPIIKLAVAKNPATLPDEAEAATGGRGSRTMTHAAVWFHTFAPDDFAGDKNLENQLKIITLKSTR